ncbi:PAS domain S-box protein [Natrinema salaciae]|uniref:PAS domain S-box-containing protein n=1 Tax=Natrinema salaciae TaxID=1186196 RepID=A0A1H9QCK2_9EURY|nr:PAS domain S-box protein [Natrinema salaciae]SER58132.1 PAS domain S-box-containing protein [Natrinema salaciae]
MSDNSSDRIDSPNDVNRHAENCEEAIDCLDIGELSELVDTYAGTVFDRDGRITAWNDGARDLTGYDADEIVGSHYRTFFPAAARDTDRPSRLLERARSEGAVETDGRRVRSDGSRFWVHELIAPIREGGAIGTPADRADELAGYVWFVYDRTEDRERERKLREEKAFAESVFDAQPDVVYAFDADENYLEWNDRVPEVTGYTDAELAEMAPLEFVAPDHRDRTAEAIRRVLGEDEYVTLEADLRTKDGRRIPYEFNSARITDDDGTVLGFTGVGRDISERKARERELREEKAFTESILEAQPDIIYAYDTEERLIQWNDQFERVAGYDSAELTGMDPLQFIVPADRAHIDEAINRIFEEGERVTVEGRVLTREGERIPYEFNSARITDDDGTVLGFTGVGRDISERKARERELERLERLNGIVRTIDETVVAAETRDEIETAIVEAFADADAYRFAVIGRAEPATTGEGYSWTPVTWAGIDAAASEAVLSSFVDPPADASVASPLETRTVQRYQSLRESAVDEWAADARERGYRSVAVVPVTASDRSFGALVIGAAEPSAFTDREREVLQEFGGTIGHAINAMAVRRLLYLDTVVELEFESSDRGDVCIDLSADAGCDLSVDHVLPLTDEVFVYYLTVSGADPETIRDVAGDDPAVTELRLIDADGAESYWEVVVRGSTITELLGEYGARLHSKNVHEGVAELTVQVNPDVDLRELVGAITSAYPDTRLVSKQTVDRSVETRGDFRRTVESMMTEKQRLALEAAYHGGYFEWPTRNSDASEIADRLGIARQTFHQHLRVAQGKLLSAYFEASE